MKRKHNEGFSLIDVLVGITLLALVVIPISSGLIMSSRINAKAEQLLQDQLAVSSAVEIMMAEGVVAEKITTDSTTGNRFYDVQRFGDVIILVSDDDGDGCYKVSASKGDVSVETQVRKPEVP